MQSLSNRQFSSVVSQPRMRALHGDIDAGAIHVGDLRVQIEQLRMNRRVTGTHGIFSRRVHPQTPAEFGWNIVMFEIDDQMFLLG